MSGICGLVLNEKNISRTSGQIEEMVHALGGSYSSQSWCQKYGKVGLGTQGIRGCETGVVSRVINGQVVALAFHGSLYNTQEISSLCTLQLNARHPLDEILFLYLEKGIDFVTKLRGEFAFAVWDGRDEILYVATDRFRVHPVYYSMGKFGFAFGSRIKSFSRCPFIKEQLSLNSEGVIHVMASSMVPTPDTIFNEIKKLPPGHIVTYKNGGIHLDAYWDIGFLQPSLASERNLRQQLKASINEAMAVRLNYDSLEYEAGTFLSGGIDSSTVTSIVSDIKKKPVKSFSIGFKEKRFNEIDFARIAAKAFASINHEYFVTPQDVTTAIPILLSAFDEPFANSSAIPTYFCAKMAKENGVDVLYAGDGGDELFAGNERYATQRLFEMYANVPNFLREGLLNPLAFFLAEKTGISAFQKAKRYIQRTLIPFPQRLSSWGLFELIKIDDLFTADFLKSIKSDFDPNGPMYRYYGDAKASTELDRQLYIDLKLIISDMDLIKVTRASEAAGITVRFPLLDQQVAEFAETVPANIKMRGRQLRSFFKRTYSEELPSEILNKEKHGFGLPIPLWLRTDKQLNEMMFDLVLSDRTNQRGYFQVKTLAKLVDLHSNDTTSFYGSILWSLMSLELWFRNYEKEK